MIGAIRTVLTLVLVLVAAGPALAAGDIFKIRIGVLKFGTVNWELDVIQNHGLARDQGIEIEVHPMAGKLATTVALQGGAVDMIVSDWIWVSRQRAAGADYTFIPYSATVGALMVPPDSAVRSLADLRGKRLGIAGGPVDKGWLLLRALAAKRDGFDLADAVEEVFAAPPLLNEQIKAGRVAGVITFWHYAARLQAAGYRRLIGVGEAARALGIRARVPLLGYVFRAAWADANRDRVLAFTRASRAAKRILGRSDAEWQRLAPLTRAKDPATLRALREGFRRGIPEAWGAAERRDAGRLFAILSKLGGAKLVGANRELQPGTFWPDLTY